MSGRFVSGSALFALVVLLLSACGRVGIELTPIDGYLSNNDSGALEDGGTGEDAGDLDGSALDGADLNEDAANNADDAATNNADDAMADTAVDACRTLCENAHGAASCDDGTCVSTCELGYFDCDGDPTNGCEANIMDEAVSCGSCTLMCTNDHGTAMCSSGLCAPTCQTNFDDCDSDVTNGCETALSTVTDCGSCGVTCSNAHGTTSCTSGACVPSCATGYADCDGDPKNGCETNTDNDPAHCGMCTHACGTNGQICVSGACAASPCSTGRAECDGDLAVTCETDTTTSLANCGFCGNACTAANGTPNCTNSTCGVASCSSGFGNCDNTASNGCETTLASSTANCGACGAGCTNAHGTTSCSASKCVPSCSTGFGDCDTSRTNGCETALDTVSNCGTCGKTCPANGGTPVCQSGVCNTICSLTGTFALKVSLNDTWGNAAYIGSGSGTHQFWLRLVGTHSGNSVTETMTECGRYVPDFSSNKVSETFHFDLPNSVFDNNFLPSSSATVTLSNSSPGASLTMPSTAFLMGTTMSNPVTATWPSSASSLTQVDMDGDGKPGMTLDYLSSGSYSEPRTGGTLFDPRADKPYSATRLVFSLNGSLTSCTQSSGSATVSHIDTRIFGCKLSGSSSDCNNSQGNFLDQNCVNYNLGSASYTMVKVADGASCATVRSAVP